MDRIESALRSALRSLTAAVRELTDIVPQPHTAKLLAHDLIAEAQDILDGQLTLEPGDAPGPSAAIAAAAERANTGDPENVGEQPLPGVLEDPASLLNSEAPANAGDAQ